MYVSHACQALEGHPAEYCLTQIFQWLRMPSVWQLGFTNEGKVIALDLDLYNNAGNTLDLSHSVMDRALLHSDGAYKIPHVRAVGHICKTNTASNTAFRGFGGPQVQLRAS